MHDVSVISLSAGTGGHTCLSIRQPWTWIITHPEAVVRCGLEPKTIENREWCPRYRGLLLLHAGASLDASLFDRRTGLLLSEYWQRMFGDAGAQLAQIMPQHRSAYPTRAIVGSAELRKVVQSSPSPWFVGCYGLVLANATALTSPISYPGQRMLFTVPDRLLGEEVPR